MAEGGDHLTILPGAVRKYEVEQTALLAGRLAFEQRLRIAGEVEERDALVLVGFVGVLMSLDLVLAAILLLAPLVRHAIVEGCVHQPVELVDIHGVDPVLKALVFGLVPFDRLLVLAAFVSMAGVQRVTYPFQHLVIEVKPPEHFSKLLLQHFLTHISAPAGGGLAPAFVGVAGAVVVDVFLLLDLADHRAAAAPAGDQAREGQVVGYAPVLAGVPAIQHTLHPLPCFARDERLVLALIKLAVPLKPAGVKAIAQVKRPGFSGGSCL